MRIVMLGTGGFAVPTCRAMLDAGHEVLAIISRPPRATRSRSGEPAPSPMRRLAEQRGLPLLMPEDINAPAALAQLEQFQSGLLVVCDYGQILSDKALATSRLGGINLHASLLPKYRGAAPINWALYDGETKTGVTVIHMTPRLDAGPCLLQHSTAIGPEEDAVQLEDRLAEMGSQAVLQALDLLAQWDGEQPIGQIQDRRQVSRARRLRKSDGAVDWSRTATQVFDQVRAFKPWPGTYSQWDRPSGPLRLLLERVQVRDADGRWGDPGTVLEAEPTGVTVACDTGRLRLLEIQPAGKRRMEISEFLRGYPLLAGQKLR